MTDTAQLYTILVKDIITNVRETNYNTPESFQLTNTFPNPFRENTTISFSLSKPDFINLSIFDVTGREVKNMITGNVNAGEHKISWDGLNSYGSKLPSGIYYYRISTSGFTKTKKMILLK